MTTHTQFKSDGRLAAVVAGTARAAARRPKRTIGLWLLLIAACMVAGGLVGTRTLSDTAGGTGESQRADRTLEASGLRGHAVENVLLRSGDPASTAAAARAFETRVRRLGDVLKVRGPGEAPGLVIAGGRTALVRVTLRGDPNKARNLRSRLRFGCRVWV